MKREIIVDNFAGGGGASTGIELGLNRHVDIAINHDQAAIDMHKMNHPETRHYCESVWDVDPVEACNGHPVGLAWFSPDCKHFSKAKGATPVNKNIRGLAWVAVRWAASVPVRMFMLENVEEFLTWGPVVDGKPCKLGKGKTFNSFIKALTTGIKPNEELTKQSGLKTNHSYWREAVVALGIEHNPKLKLQLSKGLGYQVEWKMLKACDFGVPTSRTRLFLIARKDGDPIVWPEPTHGEGLQPYKTAADIIDWNLPVKSIFGRKKPLAENSMKRIAKGLEKFAFTDAPFLAPDPTKISFITEYANASHQRNMAIDEPLRTICAQVKGGHFALVTSHIVKFRGDNIGHGTNEPLHTISAGGFHFGEVRAFLIEYYGTGSAQEIDKPLHTITTRDRFGLVMVKGTAYQIIDIGLRMLEPYELFKGMGFPADYKISHDSQGKKLTKANQVARCGNAVPPPFAEALARSNYKPLSIEIAA
ncbi:DNA cytosine methyltransferase [Marinomonas sp. BSi20584]|uniref:DNA cytosine methyltransferase n=1 Tax=Marinomonas sp. BSi20584 TaxID=1594462 RepID=UPI001E5A029A|nr:DNA cytosine methyltransferase [Marinomonas sp. BSi20584]